MNKDISYFRYEVKNFIIDMDSELHGFGGYFECTLYKDVMISINPQTHSPGNFSVCMQTASQAFRLNKKAVNKRNFGLVEMIFSGVTQSGHYVIVMGKTDCLLSNAPKDGAERVLCSNTL